MGAFNYLQEKRESTKNEKLIELIDNIEEIM
jgi:hypothetical protein